MAINWRLKTFIFTKFNITKATKVQKMILDKTGILISLQNLCNLINKKPQMIKLDTMEIICSALNCELKDILKITPASKKRENKIKLSYKNTPKSKIAYKSFPDPNNYKIISHK